jgi:hypothetical protein
VYTINDYTTCGGNTTDTCDTINGNVGYKNACTAPFNSAGYNAAYNAWSIAFALCQGSHSDSYCLSFVGSPPSQCAYVTCTLGSNVPVTSTIYSGSSGTCSIAGIDKTPTKLAAAK